MTVWPPAPGRDHRRAEEDAVRVVDDSPGRVQVLLRNAAGLDQLRADRLEAELGKGGSGAGAAVDPRPALGGYVGEPEPFELGDQLAAELGIEAVLAHHRDDR